MVVGPSLCFSHAFIALLHSNNSHHSYWTECPWCARYYNETIISHHTNHEKLAYILFFRIKNRLRKWNFSKTRRILLFSDSGCESSINTGIVMLFSSNSRSSGKGQDTHSMNHTYLLNEWAEARISTIKLLIDEGLAISKIFKQKSLWGWGMIDFSLMQIFLNYSLRTLLHDTLWDLII